MCSSLYNYINGGTPHIPSHTASDSHRGTMNMEDVDVSINGNIKGTSTSMGGNDKKRDRKVNNISNEEGSVVYFYFPSLYC